jgi:carbon-monoxide dehydrogenase medium subunit
VKAPDFAYAKPASVSEALELMGRVDDARFLAGGQSLITSLNLRLSAPSALIDLNGIADLAGISVANGHVRIGALTRHAELGRSREIAAHLPLIAKAVPHIAHPAIRNRGTIGGSLALADPATELPACCLALDASIVAVGPSGERRIAAADFFIGLFETALAPNEILVAVEFPVPAQGAIAGFGELVRRHGDYAIVGLAAQGARAGSRWTSLRLGFFGASDRPVRADAASDALIAGDIEKAQNALGQDLKPQADAENSPETKLHLAKVLLKRVWSEMNGGGA